MAKNAKKAPIHNGKPITAFFARSSRGPPGSQDASRSSLTTQPLAESSSSAYSDKADNAMKLSQSSSIASESPTKPVNAVGVGAPSSPRHFEKSSVLKPSLMSPLRHVSGKRSRSLEPQVSSIPFSTPPSENLDGSCPLLRSKLESESDVDSVITTPNPKRKKRAHLTSEEPTLSDLSDIVPSSQSDEEELRPPMNEAIPYYPVKTVSILPSPDEHDDNSMEVDNVIFGDPKTPIKSTSPQKSILIQQRSPLSDLIMTPSPSSHPSVPPTPVALDAASKTAKIIADIKAKAYAQAKSSPEPTPLEFNDISDSSSDEEDLLPILPTTTTISSNLSSDSQPTGSSIATRRSTRNAMKNRSSSPTDASLSRLRSTRLASYSGPSVTTKRRIQPKKLSVADPFAALLKEKRIAQKNGKGSDAFDRAEIRTHSFGKDDLLDDTFDGDSENEVTENEEEMALAITENFDLFMDNVVTTGIKGQDAASDVEGNPQKTLFGQGSGRAIRNILEQDKALKKHDESSEKPTGIVFWAPLQITPNASTMVDGASLSYEQLPGSNTLTGLFNSLLRRGDFSRAATLLNADFIGSLKASERPFVASKLYDLAFSLPASAVVIPVAAVHALEEFLNSSIESTESGLSFSQILATIQVLGASKSVISAQDWSIVNVAQREDITTSFRELCIQNLLILINACTRSKRLQKGDIPDIILALVLIGMDASTSSNLWRDIVVTVNLVCHCIADDASTTAQLETRVCSKMLKCVSTYEPVNKARLVHMLSSASGPMRRIANVVAYCIITDKESPDQETLYDTPPLPDVIDQLAPYSKSSDSLPGKFALHENTDYVDLGFYTTILGVAVSNLRSYVVQERQLAALRNSTSFNPRRSGEKPKTDLQLLYAALETLHSNISDTRATHLERSRTKANIKGLAMNVHYQREHWLRNLPDSRAKTLAEYFVKKPKS